ncbi:MAG: NAD-dependent epimerase/dehydratase family protein [Chthoniobacteraceae bacterium]
MNKNLPPEDLQHILDHTRELWEEMRGQRIFVTGGTGFFGCWLLESFAYANDQFGLGAKLVVLTRDARAFNRKAPHLAGHKAVTLHEGDVRDFTFPSGNFSHVIHGAATSSSPIPPLEMLETITAGTRHVLDFASACRARKFLLISSGAIYGKRPPDMIHIPESYLGELDPDDPNFTYGEGKRISEQLCVSYQGKFAFEAKIARCFAFVGPHMPLDAHFAIGNFIRDALIGGPIRVKGDGAPMRSYLYAADLAIWLWKILFRGVAGRTYNVGSGEAISIAELACLVATTLASGATVEIAEKTPINRPPARYVPDVKRAAIELDLRPLISLNEALKRTALWHSRPHFPEFLV